MEAWISEDCVGRRGASTLLYTTRMQKVAWPMTIVSSENVSALKLMNEFNAIPVMIPGSAIGSTSRSETVSRPKKRKRSTANAAIVPISIATPVARSPARNESDSAWRTSVLFQGEENQRVERPESGQLC